MVSSKLTTNFFEFQTKVKAHLKSDVHKSRPRRVRAFINSVPWVRLHLSTGGCGSDQPKVTALSPCHGQEAQRW